jgi:hypothetical protein
LKKLVVCAILSSFHAHAAQFAVTLLGARNLGGGRLSSDWTIKVNHGKPDVSVCGDDDLRPCVHLKSVKASFSLERGVDVDLARIPVLSWRWKLTRFPAAADFRHSATDDQAAQVLVAFGDRRVLAYIGDGTAPIGAAQIAPSAPLIRICRSGAAETNLKGLRLQINSQHTGAIAESYFGEVGFRSAAQ